MDYKVLYRKYRPQSFDELVGQDHIKELLSSSIKSSKLSHAYIFTGPRGTGKTSTAKLFAKTINCEKCKNGIPCNKCSACINYNESPDIIEIDAASNNGVDEIRELRENVKILPTFSKYKVYIVDEVHMLSSSAWNAFLKTLEEPPPHVIFILATTEIQKVPITVLSRCQRFDFQRIPDETIEENLKKIAKLEKINISSEAIQEIAKLAEGGARDALSFLDQLSKLDTKIDLELIANVFGVLTTKDVEGLLSVLNTGNVAEFIRILDDLQKKGTDPSILLNKLLKALLMESINEKITGENTYKYISDLENLIIDLEKCYNRSNQYILIKAILLKYYNNIENITEISEKKPKKVENPTKIISREIILQTEETLTESEKYDRNLIKIRVNNAYVEANINLKKEFMEKWKEFISVLIRNNELKYLPLVKESKVEVVSPTNVILSTEFYSNSILFNSFTNELEEKLNREFGLTKKLICLDSETWNKEKEEYLKNRKTKKYEILPEPSIIDSSETLGSAEDLFGNELIEVN